MFGVMFRPPGITAVQDVLEVLFESELGVESNTYLEIALEDRLLVFRNIVLGWVLFSWRV